MLYFHLANLNAELWVKFRLELSSTPLISSHRTLEILVAGEIYPKALFSRYPGMPSSVKFIMKTADISNHFCSQEERPFHFGIPISGKSITFY